MNDIEKPSEPNFAADGEKPDASERRDELLITWDGPDDPENPLNWSKPRKWGPTLITSAGGLVTLMSGAMLAPALQDISRDIHSGEEATNMILSIFVLAFGCGPMVLAPLSEVCGRRVVWIVCSAWYVLWNTVCGFSNSQGLMLAGRILSGLGASADIPTLADCWRAEERGYSFAIATFVPLLGPALGPILGGVITNSIGWRWLFWVLSIFDGLLTVAAIFWFPECYEQVLLHWKATKLRKERGLAYHTEWDLHTQPLATKLKRSISRPFWLLATQPILQLISIFLAYNFGTLYLVLTEFASVWTDRYHQSVSISGLHYISLVTGSTIGSQLGARATDKLWAYLKRRAHGVTAPEYRIPLLLPGLLFIPAGLLTYGWAAHSLSPWILVDIGAALFNLGLIMSTQAYQQYVMEAFQEHGVVASASAASQFLRNVFAFCFPLFAPAMYRRLGLGWGNSLLAFVFWGVGVPAPVVLWRFGGRLRAKGRGLL
ncbi:major facilitator superfamily domain-containing protein [Aspergillus carlsbadensis]|nr:major facilitator superfamily domain-containing protein [Aspergillus carlsbadensis]